jgi:D-proline reductase (dithiol) PrdB
VGDTSEFSPRVRAFLKVYRWRQINPIPASLLTKPLSECRLALVSTAGLVLPGQAEFHSSSPGGDCSFREIPGDVSTSELLDTHRSKSFDHSGVQQDPNLAFPIDRARELVASGSIGSLANIHLSFMGSITAPERLIRDSAPAAADLFAADAVDIALLVPI